MMRTRSHSGGVGRDRRDVCRAGRDARCSSPRQAATTRPYFPARGEWRKQDPAAAGFDKAKLDEAVAFAVAHENPDTKDLAVAIPNQFRTEAPYNTLIGPTEPRGGRERLDRPPRQRRRRVGRHRRAPT